MTSSLGGLSGLNTSEWIEKLVAARKTSTITPLETKLNTYQTQSSALDALKESVTKLQAASKVLTDYTAGSTSDIWSKTSVTSDNDAYVSASSTSGAVVGNILVSVKQLATNTVAKSLNSPAKYISDDTKFSEIGNGAAKGGTFSIYADNKRYEISIDKDNDTLADIKEKINTATGGKVEAKINDDGTFELSSTNGEKVALGATSDTSNFKNLMKLSTVTENGVKSSYGLTSFKITDALVGNSSLNGDITEGKIKINGVEFEIDSTTTLKDLINKINSNETAQVSAQYDTLTNKLILTSKETGEFNIALEQEGTNFFDVMGLTQDGALIEGTQTLGKNAIVNVNGNDIVSSSNTITSESTGITGLTITAKKVTDGSDSNNTTSVNLNVEKDTTEIKSAIKDFISAYNTVVGNITSATGSDGYFKMDSSLKSLQTSMHSTLMGITGGLGDFNMLSQIGISTGKAGLDISNTGKTLEFDEEKFDEAMAQSSESVKNLISAGKYDTTTSNGIFDKITSKLNDVLDVTNGMFKTKSDTLESLISRQQTSIDNAYDRLDSYEALITKQFNRMEEMISKMQQQYASFLS